MSQNTTREMLLKMRERYRRRGREGRSKLIDEVCEMCGYGRKHAIKVLGGKLPVAGALKASRGGPRCRYGDAERQVLKVIWMASEQPCGKRLKALVGLWLPHYEAERGSLEAGLRRRVLSPSAATMDRLLAPCRLALGSRRRCGTRPGSLLRKMVPVRTEHWDVAGPGWIEADTVAHCGESMSGDFCWSLTMTDVHTQWTETRAVWNKGQHGVSRSTLNYRPVEEDPEDTRIMRILDEIYMTDPCIGSRRLGTLLEREHGTKANRKRIQRLRRKMGIETIWCRPRRTSIPDNGHRKYPYLLRGRVVEYADEVWCADITYIPMPHGHAYLCAVMDWHSRKVLGWAVSNTMDAALTEKAVAAAVAQCGSLAEIFNTDQGSVFTSPEWTGRLEGLGIAVSMDGKGRWMDNVFVERLWRSLKYGFIRKKCAYRGKTG